MAQLFLIPTSLRQILMELDQSVSNINLKEEVCLQASCDASVVDNRHPLLSLHDDLDVLKYLMSESSKVDVTFLNLKRVYEKRQTRVNRKSRQKILKAKVEMVATFDAQIQDITVTVERTPESRALCGDGCGQITLDVKMGKLDRDKQHFSVDLDSVYLANDGHTPVYKLSTVDSNRRNKFHLAVTLEFIDGTRSDTFYSEPFLLRSQRKDQPLIVY